MSWFEGKAGPHHREIEKNEADIARLTRVTERLTDIILYLVAEVRALRRRFAPRLSATLTYGGRRIVTTLRVGQLANPLYQEWSGPNGSGDQLPPAGQVVYSSSDASIVSVDANSGVITGAKAGSATITATDAADGLIASTTVNVVEQAVSATLDFQPI